MSCSFSFGVRSSYDSLPQTDSEVGNSGSTRLGTSSSSAEGSTSSQIWASPAMAQMLASHESHWAVFLRMTSDATVFSAIMRWRGRGGSRVEMEPGDVARERELTVV